MNASNKTSLRYVAVTGAGGSLGEAIIDQILEISPDIRITSLDIVKPRRKRDPDRVTFVKRDVRDPAIKDDFKGVDAVLHLAFIVEKPGKLSLEQIESINVGGTQNVFKACAAAGVKQVVYASSVAAYGMHEDRHNVLLTEDMPLRGNTDFYYSDHKSRNEHWLDEFEIQHPDMKIARLRPCSFMGERSPTRPVKLLAYVPMIPKLLGFDKVLLQLAHEDDIATAFCLALEKQAHGAFNLTTDGALSPKDIGPVLGKWTFPFPKFLLYIGVFFYKLGLSPYDPEWLIKAARANVIMSAEKAKSELDWHPRYTTPTEVLRAIVGKV